VDAELPRGTLSKPPVAQAASLTLRAKLYVALVGGLTIGIAAPLIGRLDLNTHGWPTFLILASAAALTQLFVVTTTRNQSYHTAIVFLIAAALLLPPELVALMAVVQHVPDWLKHRYPWYIQTFNICNYTLNGLAAWGAARLTADGFGLLNSHISFAVGGLAACAVFVALNHVFLAIALSLGRGQRLGGTGLFSAANLSTDLVLAALGIGVATFWDVNPWLVPFGIAPLILIHRSLHVPQLEEQARIDPKTRLFNVRHFAAVLAEELSRADRFERPVSLIMADLDLLREVNNSYGHLAGDAVLVEIAEVFRAELREYDVAARFGGEEFAILLPETPADEARQIAERLREKVAARAVEVETSAEPIRVTISIGVASFPQDGTSPNELVHQADLAVYRAKLQGRNRVLAAGGDPELMRAGPMTSRLVDPSDGAEVVALPRAAAERTAPPPPEVDRRKTAPHPLRGPRLLSFSSALVALVASVSVAGIGAGVLGAVFGGSQDLLGLIAIVAVVGVGQALALEVDDGSISVSAIGALAGAALFGPRAALALALVMALVHWSAQRSPAHTVLFNVGALSLALLAAAGVFKAGFTTGLGDASVVAAGVVAGAFYYLVNTGLLSLAVAVEGRGDWATVWSERFRWLLPHYLGFGLIGGVMAIAYNAAGLYAVAVAVVPLLLMRKAQAAYLEHTQRSARKLREAAETIHNQNVSLEQANRLLRERSTAAMEGLSATVDARDPYTAGHSRRVQRLALSIGRELNLSQAELDVLSQAALFHDIGKLAVPEAILLKPASLDPEERRVMRCHVEEGANIIDRLGFLADAVPAIRHHHERFDGSGYPDGLRGEEIPLGARIIHVADAVDSMVTARVYRPARPVHDALSELRAHSGTQFCPRSVEALDRVLVSEFLDTGTLYEQLAS
jgi:diguanylate cyclase (GGDEF)-like protein/putative nucleotidyltransferase with HDIG domain